MRRILSGLFARPNNSAPALNTTREALAALKARHENTGPTAGQHTQAAPHIHAQLDFTLVAAEIGQVSQVGSGESVVTNSGLSDLPSPQPEWSLAGEVDVAAAGEVSQGCAKGVVLAEQPVPGDLPVAGDEQPSAPKPKRSRAKAGLSSSWKLPSPLGASDDQSHLIPVAFEAGGAAVLLDPEGQPCG